MTPYATSNKDLPNVNEIVYENNLDQLLEKSSANQLQDSPDIWKFMQFFGNLFEVSATFEPSVLLNNEKKNFQWKLGIFIKKTRSQSFNVGSQFSNFFIC